MLVIIPNTIPGCGCPVFCPVMQWWCMAGRQIEGVWLRSGSFLLYNELMEIATSREKLPKYLYTPDHQRAFLAITADVYGRFSAGYVVWAGAVEDDIGGERSFNYGPYVNEAPDIDAVVIQLFHAYQIWKEEQN